MKLSIITITFNNLNGLKKTVRSVINQTFSDFEFIVVDGGSNDGTKEWLNLNSLKFTKYISEEDSGIYHAQNKGIGLATGEYCLFLNAGDVLILNNVLANIFADIKSETDIAYGDVLLSNDNGIYGFKKHPDKISTVYLLKEVVAHQTQFIRRELFLKFGMYDEHYKIAADFDFFAKVFWKEKIVLQHISITTSDFDTGGISSLLRQKKQLENERKEIHKKYVPIFWYVLYYGYAKFCKLIGR